MKKSLYFAMAVLLICACNFSKGTKTDLITGLSTSYNGFAISDAYLAAEDGSRLKSNKIALGTNIQIAVTGVENFVAKDGKVFPGCMILLTDKQTNAEILKLDDAFADMADGTPVEKATLLHADLSTGSPMVAGTTYRLKTRFFDKNNPESEIVNEVDLIME